MGRQRLTSRVSSVTPPFIKFPRKFAIQRSDIVLRGFAPALPSQSTDINYHTELAGCLYQDVILDAGDGDSGPR